MFVKSTFAALLAVVAFAATAVSASAVTVAPGGPTTFSDSRPGVLRVATTVLPSCRSVLRTTLNTDGTLSVDDGFVFGPPNPCLGIQLADLPWDGAFNDTQSLTILGVHFTAGATNCGPGDITVEWVNGFPNWGAVVANNTLIPGGDVPCRLTTVYDAYQIQNVTEP